MKRAEPWASSFLWGVGFLALFAGACGGRAQGGTGQEPDGGRDDASGGSASTRPDPAHGGGASRPKAPTPTGAGGTADRVNAEGGSPSGGGAAPNDEGGRPSDVGGSTSAAGATTNDEGGAPSEPPFPSCDPLVFEDPDVEFTLRANLKKPTGPLHPADVVGLEVFSVSGVKSIKGVECLTDLQSFSIGDLPFGSVTDLSPLAGLSKLHDLDIGRNPIASLEPLGELPQLEELFANSIPVELDLTPLSRAPKLTTLYLQSDTVKDLEPLGSVSTLRSLNLRLGHVVHPEGVSALTQLEDFDATSVFTDVAPLAALTHLQKLRISRKTIQNFAKLKTLVNLRFLDISGTGVTSIAPVAQMHELVELVASGNQITQTEPLGALTLLSYVVLVDNKVVDLGPLVQNEDIGAGDFVYLDRNELACDSQAINLQVLQARGVKVSSDCQ